MQAAYLACLVALPAALALLGLFLRCRAGFTVAGACALPALAAAPMVALEGSLALELPFGSAMGGYSLSLGPLGAIFLSVSALVYLVVCLHLYGSSDRCESRVRPTLLALFMLFCSTAIMAEDALLLLLSWEGLSLSTFLLCGFSRDEGRQSWRYFAITHLGGLMVVGAALFLAGSSGSLLLSDWAGLGDTLSPTASSLAFLLLLLGFGTKFGLIPFHVWMPGLYQESPAHSVALVAAVSSNVAVFLLLRMSHAFMSFQAAHLPLALAVMILASASAIYAALRALVQDSPMRVLAYSSMKNMSLVALMLGLYMLFAVHGATGASQLALLALLLHTLFHSLFKALCVLGSSDAQGLVGSETFLGLGGLARMHPPLSALVLVGVLSMAAVPPFNGFVSEWMMIQSMMEGFALGSEPYRLALPLGMAVLGLSGALGAVAYLRLYGFTFLGRPRLSSLESLRIPRSSLLALGVLALACLLLGVLADCLVPLASHSLTEILGHDPGVSLRPPFTLGSLDPLPATLALAALALFLSMLRGRSPAGRSRTWDCGTDLGPSMQYSAMAFSQPVAQVFSPLLPHRSTQHPERALPSFSFPDQIWERAYLPLAKAYERLSAQIGRMQAGSVQAYLAYILATLMLLMVVLR